MLQSFSSPRLEVNVFLQGVWKCAGFCLTSGIVLEWFVLNAIHLGWAPSQLTSESFCKTHGALHGHSALQGIKLGLGVVRQETGHSAWPPFCQPIGTWTRKGMLWLHPTNKRWHTDLSKVCQSKTWMCRPSQSLIVLHLHQCSSKAKTVCVWKREMCMKTRNTNKWTDSLF